MKIDTEPIIGYHLSLSYNDTTMYELEDKSVPYCPTCGLRLDYFQYRPDYSTKQRLKIMSARRNLDIAATYDHQTIVSKAFRDFCLQSGYNHLEFFDFVQDPTHFQLVLTRDVLIDRNRSCTQFGKMCLTCQQYNWISSGRNNYVQWGAKNGSNVYEISEPIADGIFRSDLLVGSENKRSPWIIVGVETRAKLLKSGLIGFNMFPAYGIESDSASVCGHDVKLQGTISSKEKTPNLPIITSSISPKRRRKSG